MDVSVVERDRPPSAGGVILKTLLLAALAVVIFVAGRLWSLREVKEAQQAAGLAEKERIALQAELIECRNAMLLLQRGRGEKSGGDGPSPPGHDENARPISGIPQTTPFDESTSLRPF
jgi:hypothetical protein